MKPIALALLALAALPHHAAKSASTSVMLNAPMPLLDASRPPPGSPRYSPAPLPNPDLSPPPAIRLTPKGEAEWGAKLGQMNRPIRPGEGYSAGSNFSEDLQRRRGGIGGFAPTITLKTPIE